VEGKLLDDVSQFYSIIAQYGYFKSFTIKHGGDVAFVLALLLVINITYKLSAMFDQCLSLTS